MASPRSIGISAVVVCLILDQAHKAWMLGPFGLAEKGRIALTPFLDLVLVWNKGVSYGLLSQDGAAGRWILVAIGLAGTALFSAWMLRTTDRFQALALGLIAGGALGNVIDRIRFGAVADFFLFHVGSFQWYVFNLADVWIVAGVIGLILVWVRENSGFRLKKAMDE